jgi:hypothetical protein
MAITSKFSEVKTGGSGASIAFTAFNIARNDAIVVFIQPDAAVTTLTVSDTAGNTYVPVGNYNDGAAYIYAFYAIAQSTTSSVVVTATNTSSRVLYLGGISSYGVTGGTLSYASVFGAAPGFSVSPASTTYSTSGDALEAAFGSGYYSGGPNNGESVSIASPFAASSYSLGTATTAAVVNAYRISSGALSSQTASLSSSLGNGQNTRLVLSGIIFNFISSAAKIKLYANGTFQAVQFIEGR